MFEIHARTPSESEVLTRLRRIPFLASVPEETLARLAAQCAVIEIPTARIIFNQGEAGDALYVILAGEIQILQNLDGASLHLSTFRTGDFFGEMALFDDAARSATARALTPSMLLEIHKRDFHALLEAYSPLVGDTLRILSTRLRETNTHRLGELVRKNQELHEANRRLQKVYDATLEALSAALDLRDQATQGHSQRVTAYTLLIADELNVPATARAALQLGALLHDIGKIGVSDAILRKPTTLTPTEWTEMRKHPEWGAALVEKIEFLRDARDIVLAHHEKFDGSGYPFGLRGETIPLGARIFAVADVFDAVTTFRPYREPMAPQDAVFMIRAQAGTMFDPHVVEAFDRTFPQILAVMRASFAA
jgi:putative nucleotidyltransferase with HDIG domain